MAKRIDPMSDKMLELNGFFRRAWSNRGRVVKNLANDEQMYFSDVEDTRSQFTKEQLDFIDEKYKIPISTKISWAIIEQMISFLTGAKPYPRLIAQSEALGEWAQMYEKAFNAIWYEGKMNNELTQATRDMLAVGIGWIRIRKNDFYNETTFNVVSEYVDWRKVMVDPHSYKNDFSDAEYIIHAEFIPVYKAEKRYDIDIDYNDSDSWTNIGLGGSEEDTMILQTIYPYDSAVGFNDKNRYVWVREFFQKVDANVYLSDNGNVSSKKPMPTEVPNPDKIELQAQIQQLMMQKQQATQAQLAAKLNAQSAEQYAQDDATGTTEAMSEMAQAAGATAQVDNGVAQLDEQLRMLSQQMAQMPDLITVYDFETIVGDKIQVREFIKTTQKLIKRYLCVGNKIIEQELLPCNEYPLIPFTMSHARNPSKVYGVMHYIKDMVKAMNKFWAALIYDMQVNSNRKVLYAANTITDPHSIEEKWSEPDAWIEYQPNADAKDQGLPQVLQPTPLNPAFVNVIQMLQGLIEYITGISAVVQGQATSATPDSFGGISTLQSFGTQRIKLYSRYMESSLEKLAYVTVCYLQAYAPKDKVLTYLDEDGNQHEIELLQNNEDIKFKVRVNLASNLPTQRHMAAQLLGAISGQTKNPAVADALTEAMLKYLDMPDAQNILDRVDTVKNLQSQLQQMQDQAQKLTSENEQLKQQMFQKDIEVQKQLAMQEIKAARDMKLMEVDQNKDVDPTLTAPTIGTSSAPQEQEPPL